MKLNFGQAIVALEEGKAIQRIGWNGKGMFVVKQVPASIGANIIPGMQSLPDAAKGILMARENQVINYSNQMLLIQADGRADSWVPSSSDIFAKDWQIVDDNLNPVEDTQDIAELEDWQRRLIDEYVELSKRADSLGHLLSDEACVERRVDLDVTGDLQLLQLQFEHMCNYEQILEIRLKMHNLHVLALGKLGVLEMNKAVELYRASIAPAAPENKAPENPENKD